MTTRVPPDSVSTSFTAYVPAPAGMSSISAYLIEGIWAGSVLGLDEFTVQSDPQGMTGDVNTARRSFAAPYTFPGATEDLPLSVTIDVTPGGGDPAPGTTLTLTVKGAQTADGWGALSLDNMGAEVFYGEPIELGTIEVVTWLEWRHSGGS